MRRNAVWTGLSIFALSLMFFSPALGQFPFPGGGGQKSGFGGGPGGFGGMPFGGGGGGFSGSGRSFGGGPGGFSGGGMSSNPTAMFDFLARGRSFFLVTETRSLRGPLEQFLASKGITNGQVTRELFTQFSEQAKTSMGGGMPGMVGPRGPGGPGGMFMANPTGPTGPTPGMTPSFEMGGFQRRNPLDTMYQFADAEFARYDQNGDTVLNLDEMPDAVKNDLNRFDANHDNLIDLSEYRVHFLERMRGGDGRPVNPVTVILQEEFDTRPTVLRAGKLPKELRWFEELDTNKDGQIALYEWRQAGKDIEEFATYDRNDDGFMTPEEALRVSGSRGGSSYASRWGSGDEAGEETPRFGNGSQGGPAWMTQGGSSEERKNWMKDFMSKKGKGEWPGNGQGGPGGGKKKKGFGGGN